MLKVAVANLTKRPTPVQPWLEWKNQILGPDYDLSLVFCDAKLAHQLNLTYRHKDKIANILSFPLSNTTGEIFIKLPLVGHLAPNLFIHGLFHLKGLTHGSKMESEEKKFSRQLKPNGQPQHHRRARYRNSVDSPRRLRTKIGR